MNTDDTTKNKKANDIYLNIKDIIKECTNPTEFILKLNLNGIPFDNEKTDLSSAFGKITKDIQYDIYQNKNKISYFNTKITNLKSMLESLISSDDYKYLTTIFNQTDDDIEELKQNIIRNKKKIETEINQYSQERNDIISNNNGLYKVLNLISEFKNKNEIN